MTEKLNWIEWKGGKCPISDDVKWAYKMQGGFVCRNPDNKPSAYPYSWNHKMGDLNIIAYAIHEQTTPTAL